MYQNGAFDHISGNCLPPTMEYMDAVEVLMRWAEFFMSDRSVGLVIDNHQCTEAVVDTGVSNGSPALSIIFVVHLSGVFRQVEKEVEECTATLF